MKKVFLDSSVLVAACASNSGASALILGLSKNKKIQCFASLEVLAEAKKNIIEKLGPRGQDNLKIYLKKANINVAPSPSLEKIKDYETIINGKDAPILASALIPEIEIILSLDKKPCQILSPGEFIRSNLKPFGLS